MTTNPIARALTIAGSDSGGGAGIQADLKTFAAFGVYGMSAITALTAQNTVDVTGVVETAPEFVTQQIDAVVGDIGVDAAKTGMLSSAAIVRAVAEAVSRWKIERLVVDPVMISKSGHSLLRADAVDALKNALLPRALIVTPNIPEAEALAGVSGGEARLLAERILKHGPRYVLVKGGHHAGPECTDFLLGSDVELAIVRPRIETKNTHGTGCTYSAAITACLALGIPLIEAVQTARDYLQGALLNALPLGSGHGPLDHAWSGRNAEGGFSNPPAPRNHTVSGG
jgi:hydroxymethylpyrimidine/phosphomethylpyrimidine kinase